MRKWVSLLLGFSFLVLLVTGVVLYIEPPGRVAYWTNWKLLGLGKDQWDGVHTVFGFFFLILALWHLLLNWRALSRYLKQGMSVLGALGLTLVIFWGTVTYKKPFQWIVAGRDYFKYRWKSPGPPIPHAELMSLRRVACLMGLKPQTAVDFLRKTGLTVTSSSEKFGEIARQNGKTPAALFEILQKARKESP